ncbi:hypothetical protein [Burkholderia pseudomallei]|uniref:hypothetical protein n=1 Tax=Burkholderia pseudomallei TaxID=28450 RepID=UPI0006178864|nr:hypothetical protein [Burkholderia pseudomallei]KKB70020.1 hypothetical protein BBMA_4345 [Burkholderia pseudomallei MSHR1079]
MTQLSQSHIAQDLLEFYDRVNPVLSKWLVKPTWTAEETAMLCAGFVPNFRTSGESKAAHDLQQIDGRTPIDIDGYLQPDYELYCAYLHLLTGKGEASPRDMVVLLLPAITSETREMNRGGEGTGFPSLRLLTIDSLRELQWLFIIGNAVGLPVPALIPFDLLNALRDRLTSQPVIELSTNRKKGGLAATGAVAETKLSTRQRKPRGHPPVLTTPAARGYYTTAEVAGLTGLRTDTLNTYARKGVVVDGFTPFKRRNGKPWQWRDNQQQALHVAGGASHATPDPQQGKSLASLLGPTPFTKS